MSAIRAFLLCGFLLSLARAQGIGANDAAPWTDIVAYSTAAECVRNAVDYAIGYELLHCTNDLAPALCLCETTAQNLSPTIANAIYTSASRGCAGTNNQGPAGRSIFEEYCAANMQAAASTTGPASTGQGTA